MMGLGAWPAQLCVMVATPPPLAEYRHASSLQAACAGQIHQIGADCGNGWRKVFNVYAKLVFALPAPWQPPLADRSRWQQWRDQCLLQAGSGTALLFGESSAQQHILALQQTPPHANQLTLIAGRQHARALIAAGCPLHLHWFDDEFAIDKALQLIVCPYFDYRQLSDVKISRLAGLLADFASFRS